MKKRVTRFAAWTRPQGATGGIEDYPPRIGMVRSRGIFMVNGWDWHGIFLGGSLAARIFEDGGKVYTNSGRYCKAANGKIGTGLDVTDAFRGANYSITTANYDGRYNRISVFTQGYSDITKAIAFCRAWGVGPTAVVGEVWALTWGAYHTSTGDNTDIDRYFRWRFNATRTSDGAGNVGFAMVNYSGPFFSQTDDVTHPTEFSEPDAWGKAHGEYATWSAGGFPTLTIREMEE